MSVDLGTQAFIEIRLKGFFVGFEGRVISEAVRLVRLGEGGAGPDWYALLDPMKAFVLERAKEIPHTRLRPMTEAEVVAYREGKE